MIRTNPGDTRRRWFLSVLVAALLAAVATAVVAPQAAYGAYQSTVTNYDSAGDQVVRFDTRGNAVDAHDGEISVFNGTYYLYGTSYDCGFQWKVPGAPFCGFKVYTSTDLVHWADRGYLFDATSTWQTRCDGGTTGCFRPHVVYNAATQKYVLWINSYDNGVDYHVFTASRPTGPFTEAATPTLAVNNGQPPGVIRHGDHSLFVDDDGTAYLVYTDWIAGGDIVVERLSSDYLTGSGSYTRLHQSTTEAPAMFRRGSTYYITYSDPNCGYCATGTSYKTASSPLGTWSARTNVSTDSCAGQPSFVSAVPTTSGTAYLFASDQWNNANPSEALANYFWAPLSFGADGSIAPITCQKSFSLDLATGSAGAQRPSPELDQSDGVDGFRSFCDIGNRDRVARIQTFVAGRTGTLTTASYTTFQSGTPNAGLEVDIYPVGADLQPSGPALFSQVLPQSSIGWSPRDATVYPNIAVTAGTRYGIALKSTTTAGCYGMVYNDSAPYPGGGQAYSDNSGATYRVEANRSTKFSTTVSDRAALPTTQLPAGYAQCAAENGVCTAAVPSVVAYGAGSSYVYQTVPAGTVPCTNAAFGTDPVYGLVKSCSVAPAAGPAGSTSCAAENGTCTFTGTRTVAYGANGAFTYRQATGSTPCTNAVFGDPFYGVVKACYLL